MDYIGDVFGFVAWDFVECGVIGKVDLGLGGLNFVEALVDIIYQTSLSS